MWLKSWAEISYPAGSSRSVSWGCTFETPYIQVHTAATAGIRQRFTQNLTVTPNCKLHCFRPVLHLSMAFTLTIWEGRAIGHTCCLLKHKGSLFWSPEHFTDEVTSLALSCITVWNIPHRLHPQLRPYFRRWQTFKTWNLIGQSESLRAGFEILLPSPTPWIRLLGANCPELWPLFSPPGFMVPLPLDEVH